MQRYFEINENSHNIRCKLYYSDIKDIRRVVLFVHGFGGHKDNSAAERFAERLINKYKRVAMLTFDLCCHGDDVKKKLTLDDCQTYIELVIKHIREKMSVEEIFCYATSFGGYLTLKYIADKGNPFVKIALRCPAVNMYETIRGAIIRHEDMALIEKGKEALVGFDRKVAVTGAFLDELQSNTVSGLDFLDFCEDMIIIHGTADEIVPFETSCEFADNNLIEFVAVDGADHRFHDPKKMEIATKAILDFYAL